MNINFQAGQHPSLVCLLGICEEASSTLVVMEHGEPSMKQWLLGSRALDHQPQYAARHGRVATARSLNFPILWTSADVIPHLLIDFLGGRQAFFLIYIHLFREELLLELVSGLASGLHHLHQAGIYHGAVCARNVFMVGETGNDDTLVFA